MNSSCSAYTEKILYLRKMLKFKELCHFLQAGAVLIEKYTEKLRKEPIVNILIVQWPSTHTFPLNIFNFWERGGELLIKVPETIPTSDCKGKVSECYKWITWGAKPIGLVGTVTASLIAGRCSIPDGASGWAMFFPTFLSQILLNILSKFYVVILA